MGGPEKPEKPKLTIVGGKDYEPDSKTPDAESSEDEAGITETQLRERWMEIMKQLPANYNQINPEAVADAADKVRRWSVGQLYIHLSLFDVWTQPAMTKAAIMEVAARVRLKNFSPRK